MIPRALILALVLVTADAAPAAGSDAWAVADTIYGGYLLYTFNGGSNDCQLLQHDAAVGERLHLAQTSEFGREGVACAPSIAAYHSVGWPAGALNPGYYTYFDIYAGSGFRIHFAAGDRLAFSAHRLNDDLDSLEVRILYAPDHSETLLKTALADSPTGYALPLPRITTDSYANFRFYAWSARADAIASGILVLDEVALTFREVTDVTGVEDETPGRHWSIAPPYPNPGYGDATTTITLDAPAAVRVELVNALGQRAATLIDGSLPPGKHVLTIDLSRQPSGVYFIRAFSDTEVQVQRVVVGR